jgi:hypothetical protein
MNTAVSVLSNIFIIVISSIPGLFLTKYLEEKGIVRKTSRLLYFSFVIVIPVVFAILRPHGHWLLFMIYTLLISTLGIHRFELGFSMLKGRWWWLKDKRAINQNRH